MVKVMDMALMDTVMDTEMDMARMDMEMEMVQVMGMVKEEKVLVKKMILNQKGNGTRIGGIQLTSSKEEGKTQHHFGGYRPIQ